LSVVWDFIYRARRFAYQYGFFKSHNFAVPVISVGNLSFGGSGKTPFTRWLAQYFESQNKKVMILMRGYRGRIEHSAGLLRAGRRLGNDPEIFGDEALMLVRHLKNACIGVGRKRGKILKKYFPQIRPEVVLLDDGHQHLAVGRDMNIVLFDALMPLASMHVAPLGYLREGPSSLASADYIAITRANLVPAEKLRALEGKIRQFCGPLTPIAHVSYVPSALMDLNFEFISSCDVLKGKKVVAVAGLASPQAFFRLLEECGALIEKRFIYPDHHDYVYTNVMEWMKYIEPEGSDNSPLADFIVTTEKDIVKIRRLVGTPKIVFVELGLEFTNGEDELVQMLGKYVHAQI
jgi:tetraacyldisaccharide 4'-kinase